MKSAQPHSVTPRQSVHLIAKSVTRGDLPFWMEIYKDPEVLRQMYAAPLESDKALWRYLHCEQKAFTVWESQKRIGGFLLSAIAPFIGTFSVVIHTTFRGRGYGGEVMRLIEQEATKESFKTLRADVYCDNKCSIALLENCGFRQFLWLEKNI